ncbi:MAG TPA: hypothetical protein ENN67_06645 [Firmicutes bacterium]|nr:hypothetical protein [Bacillota bacterium]
MLAGLTLFFCAIFSWAFTFAELAAELVTGIAVGLSMALLLVPSRRSGIVLMYGLALSIPFCHFAMVIVGDQGIQWQHLFGSFLIFHLIVRILFGGKLRLAPATGWILAFVAATLISTFAFIDEPAEHVTEFAKSEIQYLYGVLLFFSISNINPKSKELIWFLKAMLIMSALVALFGIYQLPARFFGWPGGVVRLNNPSLSGEFQAHTALKDLTRAASIFSEPGYFGRFLVGSLALSLPIALHRPKFFGSPFLIWLIITIQAGGLIISSSMGAWYILANLTVVMFLVERVVEKVKLLTWLGIVSIFGIAILISIELVSGFPIIMTVTERIHGIIQYFKGDMSQLIAGESLVQRIETGKIALDVWKENPVIGVGVGSYTLISYRYGEYNPFGFAANSLVNTLAETGLVGLIALLGLSFSSLRGLWKIFSRTTIVNPEENPGIRELADLAFLARPFFYLLAVEVIYFHLGGFLMRPEVWFYFGIAGLIPLLYRRKIIEIKLNENKQL